MILGLVGPRLGVSPKVLRVVAAATSSYEGTAVIILSLRLQIGGVSFRVLFGSSSQIDICTSLHLQYLCMQCSSLYAHIPWLALVSLAHQSCEGRVSISPLSASI